jgi:hypothetical protein
VRVATQPIEVMIMKTLIQLANIPSINSIDRFKAEPKTKQQKPLKATVRKQSIWCNVNNKYMVIK